MSATAEGAKFQSATTTRPNTLGRQIVRVITTTDHKVIGKLYLATSFAWFLAAGGTLANAVAPDSALPA